MPIGRDLCEHCGAPSPVYHNWWRCNDCYDYVCNRCAQPGTEYEDEGHLHCQCAWCYEADHNEHDDLLDERADPWGKDEEATDVDFS